MKVLFLGTRGYIEARTELHYMHSSLMVIQADKRIMFDCGEDWLNKFRQLAPDCIFITHAHPDHAWGLKDGAPCPIYASEDSWKIMEKYPVESRITVKDREIVEIYGISVEPFALDHSIRAPAMGYRVADASSSFFYSPDVVYIRNRPEALKGISVYIGDGATIKMSMVRRDEEGHLYGHTPVMTQLTWCAKEKVGKAVITHCGKQIVEADPAVVEGVIKQLAEERGVEAILAYDGLMIDLEK